jgi:hypothetical protein
MPRVCIKINMTTGFRMTLILLGKLSSIIIIMHGEVTKLKVSAVLHDNLKLSYLMGNNTLFSSAFPVILYSCSLMGTNCGQCLAQESRFECSYCVEGPAPPVTPGNCQFEATCSTGNGFLRFNDPGDVQNCPRPVITVVSSIIQYPQF